MQMSVMLHLPCCDCVWHLTEILAYLPFQNKDKTLTFLAKVAVYFEWEGYRCAFVVYKVTKLLGLDILLTLVSLRITWNGLND